MVAVGGVVSSETRAPTVSVADPEIAPNVAEIVVVPPASPVAFPLGGFAATDVWMSLRSLNRSKPPALPGFRSTTGSQMTSFISELPSTMFARQSCSFTLTHPNTASIPIASRWSANRQAANSPPWPLLIPLRMPE